MPKSIGLYLHIPFCKKKCSYCDFYSAFTTDDGLDKYTEALINEIKRWGGSLSRPISTIYFGGGTPSLLGKRIADILQAVKESFHIADDAEITAEVNPDEDTKQKILTMLSVKPSASWPTAVMVIHLLYTLTN